MQKFKNYMLPVAMIVGALGRSWMAEAAFLMPWLLFFMLLFSFARIAPREVTFTRLHVLLLSIQLFGSLLVYAALRGWNPVVAEGVFICVLAPTATASAVITGLLGGSVGFMTSYVLTSNVMVSVAAPVLFSHIGINGDLPFWESVWTICGEVMPILLLPLAAAWLIRWLWPRAQGWFGRMSQVPLYLWAISLTIVTGRTVDFLIEQENPDYWVELSIAGITMIICFLQFLAGRRLGRRYGDRISGGQALMQKNTVLAIWMSQIYLNPVASVGPGAYILWQNILNSWQLWRKGRQETKMKIKPTETVIDSTYNHWWFGNNHLTPEEGKEVSKRIHWLRFHYLKEVFVNGWEILYQDPEDFRYWELTYPHGDYHGGGPPSLRYLTDEEVLTKYKISPRYIPELRPKQEETVIDSYELTENLSLIEADKIYFRIRWLRQYYLKKIVVVSEEEMLYRDPEDRRYWELSYPHGYLYGMGSPLLRYITDEEVEAKYHVKPK